VLLPGVTTVVGDTDEQRSRCGVPLLLTAERRPTEVDGAEERTRGRVVRPDLLLSEKIVCETCFETITGGIQAFLSLAAAACTLSVRETAIASKPLKVASSRVAPKFEVRFP